MLGIGRAQRARLRLRLKRPGWYLGWLYLVIKYPAVCIDTFEVRLLPVDRLTSPAMREVVLDKLRRALAEIREFDPARYRRMQHTCSHIVVARSPSSFYLEDANSCWLAMDIVIESTPALTACVLVHEFAHAALCARGMTWSGHRKWHGRMERICVEEEIAFLERAPAERYPGKTHVIEQLRASLLEQPHWTPEQRRRRHAAWLAWRREQGLATPTSRTST